MKNLSILYVEDDPIVRENFTEILHHYFSTVYTAEDGEKAYRIYNEKNPDAVLLDISLPKMSGLDLAEKIRQNNQNIEIIMMTAFSEQDKLFRAVNLQLHAYLVKPVNIAAFDSCMKSLFFKYKKNEKTVILSESFVWDKDTESLFYKHTVVALTKNERLILILLIKHLKQFFKPCDIYQEIFTLEQENDPMCNNIVQIISRFKNKINKQFPEEKFFISNTYGSGYKIVLNK